MTQHNADQNNDDRSAAPGGPTRLGGRRAVWLAGLAAAGAVTLVAITVPRGAAGVGQAGDPASAGGAKTGALNVGAGRTGAGQVGAGQAGQGPLTQDEIERAKALVLRADPMTAARDVNGAHTPEYLSADLTESAAATDQARRVEVLFYDYAADRLIKKTVNLTSGVVERSDSADRLQPPPSQQEATAAADLLIKSPLGTGLRTDFKAATQGTELTRAAQLTLRGITYNTALQSGPSDLSDCGEHRCVRLFTRVKDGPWIDATDLVIDLSDRSVGRIHP